MSILNFLKKLNKKEKKKYISKSKLFDYDILEKEEIKEEIKEVESIVDGDFSLNPIEFNEEKNQIEIVENNNNSSKEDFMFRSIETDEEKLERLFYNYRVNLNNDPVLAKEYLLKYVDLCRKLKITFDYNLISQLNDKIFNLNIPKWQLKEEEKLSKQIEEFLRKKPNSNQFRQVPELINKYNILYKDRGFYAKYYRGCYENYLKNYKKSINIFNDILKSDPENVLVLRKIMFSYFNNFNFGKCKDTIFKYLNYKENDTGVYILLAKCYVINGEFSKLQLLSDSLMEGKKINQREYFKNIVNFLENTASDEKSKMFCFPDVAAKKAKFLENLYPILEQHKEMLGMVLSESNETYDSLIEEYNNKEYEEKIYDCIYYNSDNMIDFSNIDSYIESFESENSEEKMLLYLAAAKILFQNKFVKQAEYYLKKVEQEKNKSDYIKKQYDIAVKTKKLHLNK